jgi:uncharacterized protein
MVAPYITRWAWLCLVAFFCAGCGSKEGQTVNEKLSNLNDPLLAFVCVRELDHVPAPSPDAEKLFQQARAMEKAAGPKDFNAIAKIYTQAGDLGHWKALQNLQALYYQGLADHTKPEQHVIDINEKLIKMGVPIGYYNMATYLEQGYGVKQDRKAALTYYRKSADLGSTNGQAYVGKLLVWDLKNFDVGVPMLECALNQGSAAAAHELSGYYREFKDDLNGSLRYLQRGTALGDESASSLLVEAFEKGPEAFPTDYKTDVDKERARRYRLIQDELDRNPSARFPDIDKIVPLPPAPLPAWNGEFEYRKAGSK